MNKYARFRFQPCLPLGKDGRRITASEENIAVSRKAAGEGMVLLKNINDALPFEKGEKIALFGKASIEYIKGGGGSGDVYCPYIRSILDGFRVKENEGKVSVYMPLSDFYKNYVEEAEKSVPTEDDINKVWDVVNNMEFCQKRDDMTYDTFASMHVPEPEVPDELIVSASENADTAIITLSRFSAEGVDRRPQGGDYYLSDLEKHLIDRTTELFGKVIIVINSGAVLDCEYFAENDKVQAILMGWQGGMEGGLAIADILTGDVNPSGKMPDILTKSYECYPSVDDFNESFDYVKYHEDIYVGYRYFETIPGAKENIRYPFGFGLSYTTFEMSGIICGESGGKITAALNIRNRGKRAGKEVAEIYFSAPQGKLGKPRIQLAAFGKTKLLAPGEAETLAVSFDINSMASFDDTGKISRSAYVLEKGEYIIYAGNSSENLTEIYRYKVEEDRVTEQLTRLCRPFRLDKRMLSDGSFEEMETGEASYYYGEPTAKYSHKETEIPFDEVGKGISLSDFADQFTLEEMMDFVGGHGPTGVCNTGCFGGLDRLKVPPVPTADGPAGLRLSTETGLTTTAFPCATLLAASFNTEICREVGSAAATEIRENNIGVWLAPALNIHRNPLCGRNFEYFSEDPVLAGTCAAAEFRGIQSRKVAVSMKHFACNNKEAKRFASDSILSERALREIYLKAFEIAVREGHPLTVMSSYNLINGQHTSESWELLTGILRNEWGFNSMVETDWGVKNDPVAEVRAGNDLKMHMGYPEDLKKGLEAGIITPDHLKTCVERILYMFTQLAE